MIPSSRAQPPYSASKRERHQLFRVSSGRLYIRGGLETAALDRYKAALAKARHDALVQARRAQQLQLAGGDDVIGIEAAADILGYSLEHTRLLFRQGQVRGAYLERRRWQIKKRHLWAHLRLQPHDALITAS